MFTKTLSALFFVAVALVMVAPAALADSSPANCQASSGVTQGLVDMVDFGQIPDWMNVKTSIYCPSCHPVSCFSHQDCAASCWGFNIAFCRNGTCAFECGNP